MAWEYGPIACGALGVFIESLVDISGYLAVF